VRSRGSSYESERIHSEPGVTEYRSPLSVP